MCGLAGVAGDLGHKDTDVFKELLYHSQVRGNDASGLCGFETKTGTVDIFKRAVPSSTFIDLRRVDNMITTRNDVLMGHTRKSTSDWQSKYNHEDAHPFYWNDLVGMHNGMIPFQALGNLPHELKGAIDSEKLIYNISKEGIDKVLPKIWGAWALALLDAENKKLGFVRNKERSLSYAFSKDKKKIYWASEGQMLYWVLQRNGIETLEQFPRLLEEDTLMELDLASGKPIAESVTITRIEGGKEPEKKAIPPTTGGRGVGPVSTRYKPSKGVSPQQAALNMIQGMEMQLIGFDHSTRHKWAKPQRKRFEGLVTALNRIYAEWASGDIPEEETAKIVDPLVPILTGDLLVAKLLSDNGCAFCCKDSVEPHELKDCGVGATGDVLCNICNTDASLRHIAQVPAKIN